MDLWFSRRGQQTPLTPPATGLSNVKSPNGRGHLISKKERAGLFLMTSYVFDFFLQQVMIMFNDNV